MQRQAKHLVGGAHAACEQDFPPQRVAAVPMAADQQVLQHARVLEGQFKVTLPQGAGMPDANTAEVVRRLDEELTFVADAISSDFIAAIYLIEFSPAAYGYFGRMSRLEPANRVEFLKRAGGEGSDLVRAAVSNIRMLILLCYYGHASTWKKIGYDGPFAGLPEKLSEQRKHYRQLSGMKT